MSFLRSFISFLGGIFTLLLVLIWLVLLPVRLLFRFFFRRPDMVFLKEDHPEMKVAHEQVLSTFSEFKTILSNPAPEMGDFAVKVAFPVCSGSEHIWIGDLKLEDGIIRGKLANDPDEIEGLVCGDPVKVDENMISDWAYSKDGYYHGHFKTRVLMSHMKKSMRKQVMEIYGWNHENNEH